MTMRDDPVLTGQLRRLIALAGIDVVVETGTYLGTGSTRFIAGCFSATALPKRFVTMEVNFSNWCHAKNNLRAFPFVECRWGCSIALETALRFLDADEMLHDHASHPGIYVDDTDDPVAFYKKELRGQIGFAGDVGLEEGARALLWDGEDLLSRLLAVHRGHRPLIVLDSAGGIGLLEFQTVLRAMGEKPFFLLLDDTHHIKHHRSLKYARMSPRFDIITEGSGWALASCGVTVRPPRPAGTAAAPANMVSEEVGSEQKSQREALSWPRTRFFPPPVPRAIPLTPPPDFDPDGYLLANPDVAAAGVDPGVHYLDIGWREYRVWASDKG